MSGIVQPVSDAEEMRSEKKEEQKSAAWWQFAIVIHARRNTSEQQNKKVQQQKQLECLLSSRRCRCRHLRSHTHTHTYNIKVALGENDLKLRSNLHTNTDTCWCVCAHKYIKLRCFLKSSWWNKSQSKIEDSKRHTTLYLHVSMCMCIKELWSAHPTAGPQALR